MTPIVILYPLGYGEVNGLIVPYGIHHFSTKNDRAPTDLDGWCNRFDLQQTWTTFVA